MPIRRPSVSEGAGGSEGPLSLFPEPGTVVGDIYDVYGQRVMHGRGRAVGKRSGW